MKVATLVLVLVVHATGYHVVDAGKTEQDLMEHVLKGIDPAARPVKNISSPVDVLVDLWPVQLEDLDERHEVLHLFAWLTAQWRDENIGWDPAEWGGAQSIIVPINRLWRPDMVVRNSAFKIRGEILDEDSRFRAEVTSDGVVLYSTAGSVATSCSIDIRYFPFDDQACYVHIDSWTYRGDKVRMWNISEKLNMDVYRESGMWDVIDTESRWITETYGEDMPAYYEMKFVLYLRRKPMYYVTTLMVPSILMSFLLMPVFLLPPESGEKVSLAITLLLAFSVFQLLIADSMPKTSGYMPLLGIYILGVIGLAALSLFSTVLVLRLHHHDPRLPVPKSLKKFTRCIGSALCMNAAKKRKTSRPPASTGVATSHNGGNGVITIDPQSEKMFQVNDQVTGDVMPADADVIRQLRSIADDVQALRIQITKQGNQPASDINEDWIRLAMVLDRLFLVLFLIACLSLAVVLVGVYPLTKPAKPLI